MHGAKGILRLRIHTRIFWELMKFDIRSFSQLYSKLKAKNLRDKTKALEFRGSLKIAEDKTHLMRTGKLGMRLELI